MPQERAEKRIDELQHLSLVTSSAKVPVEQSGIASWAAVSELLQGMNIAIGIDETDGLLYLYKDGVKVGEGVEVGGGGDIVRYNITATLSNATLSNTATKVKEGATYTSAVVADTDFAVDTVTVTMGGVVVANAYSNGQITVRNVSGDLAITVTTKAAITLSDGTVLSTIMFEDDFDDTTISSVWKLRTGQANVAAENTWYKPENVTVQNSCLVLTLKADDSVDGYNVTGAQVGSQNFDTANNYNFDTGYFEARFKVENLVSGFWPAIWHIGQTQSETYVINQDESVTRTLKGKIWPWCGEIDEFDYMSGFRPGLVYSDDDYSDSVKTYRGQNSYTINSDEWHTVGVLKTKTEIKIFYDRVLCDTFNVSDNPCFSGRGEKIIFDAKYGSLAGELPQDFTQSSLYIDYVKVYSLGNSYTTLAEQAGDLIPDYANGYSCVANRYFLIHPVFALNTQNTALYWASSNTSVAMVENGYVHTIANGTAVITATDVDGNEVIRYTQTVKNDAGVLADSIKVLNAPTSVPYGSSVTINANIYPTNCDVLTPTLTVVSGGEYVSISGQTITATNSTNENKTVVIRVGTNNPAVYEDITFSSLALIDNIDTNGLVAKYTLKGWTSTAWNPDVSGNNVWTTSQKQMTYYAGLGYMNGLAYTEAVQKVAGVNLVDIDGAFTLATRLLLKANDTAADANLITLQALDENSAVVNNANGQISHNLKSSYYKYKNAQGNVVNGNFGSIWGTLDHTVDNVINLVVTKTADGYVSAYLNGTQIGNTQSWFVGKDPIDMSCRIGISGVGGLAGYGYYQAFLAWNKAMTAEEVASFNSAINEMYGT